MVREALLARDKAVGTRRVSTSTRKGSASCVRGWTNSGITRSQPFRRKSKHPGRRSNIASSLEQDHHHRARAQIHCCAGKPSACLGRLCRGAWTAGGPSRTASAARRRSNRIDSRTRRWRELAEPSQAGSRWRPSAAIGDLARQGQLCQRKQASNTTWSLELGYLRPSSHEGVVARQLGADVYAATCVDPQEPTSGLTRQRRNARPRTSSGCSPAARP
jgi:hypothetical protein